jgi:cytochrome bd-type quinol oxidase subunit 2
MPVSKITSKEYFRILKILHFALAMGQLLFAGVTLLLVFGKNSSYQQNAIHEVLIFAYLVPFVALTGLAVSIFVFKNHLAKIKNKNSLEQKTGLYQTAQIIRWAAIEGPGLFALVIFLLTGNSIIFGIFGLLILYFVSLYPSREKAIADMELNYNESQQINDDNTLIAELKK